MSIDPSEKNGDDRLAEAQLRKLELEIQSLEKQNSWKGQLTHYATLATILTTVIGIWLGVGRFMADAQKERDIREKEIVERIDSQYRSDIERLLGFPMDEKLTIPYSISLLQDMKKLIATRPQAKDDDKAKQKADVASLFANLITSTEYDFEKGRNVEFEQTILDQWEEYTALLVQKPDVNMDITSEYFNALRRLHNADPKMYESVMLDKEGGQFSTYKPADKESELLRFIDLFHGYKRHVEILKSSIAGHPEQAAQLGDSLHLTLCWLYGATRNRLLTENAFNLDDASLKKQWEACP